MVKIKVKILESIAGLADPKPTADLDAQYDQIRSANRAKDKPLGDRSIELIVSERKNRDRYGEVRLGFPRDWSFAPNQEVLIDADLAQKWQDCGLCEILPQKAAA